MDWFMIWRTEQTMLEDHLTTKQSHWPVPPLRIQDGSKCTEMFLEHQHSCRSLLHSWELDGSSLPWRWGSFCLQSWDHCTAKYMNNVEKYCMPFWYATHYPVLWQDTLRDNSLSSTTQPLLGRIQHPPACGKQLWHSRSFYFPLWRFWYWPFWISDLKAFSSK